MQANDTGSPVTASPETMAAFIEGWRIMVVATLAATLLVASWVVVRRQRFEASLTLSTVTSTRSLPLGAAAGIASQLLNINTSTGLQPTPALVARLTRLQSVLLAVAATRLPDDSVAVIERVTGRPLRSLSNATILRTMSQLITPSFDRETGLVTIRVVSKDSTLARVVAERTVSEIGRAFRQASRAQAAELREAQQARLDSAESQLRHAEQRLIDFLAANRLVAQYSTLQAQFQSLQRSVDIAQTVYLQVRTERESAVGKELEDTPAVVVLDSLPSPLPRVSVNLGGLFAFALVLGVSVGAGLILLRERAREYATDPTTRARLAEAFATLPFVKRRTDLSR